MMQTQPKHVQVKSSLPEATQLNSSAESHCFAAHSFPSSPLISRFDSGLSIPIQERSSPHICPRFLCPAIGVTAQVVPVVR